MIRNRTAALSAVLLLTLAAGPVAASDGPIPTATVVQDGLVIPWDVAFAPDGRMLVTERGGAIHVYASGAPAAPKLSTTIVPLVRAEHESGVNGLAIDTAFGTHPYVYVCASRDLDGSGPEPWLNEILRYRLTPAGSLTDPAVIFTGARADTQHNGCALEMDATGHLWAGIGDGRVPGLAQDPASFNGKILRMLRDGSVPSDNPRLVATEPPTQVFSMGHRNPQGIAFEPGTGRVYAAEHGPNVDDEVNRLQAGGNYGWPCVTGFGTPYLPSACDADVELLDPAWASGTSTIATSGMTFLGHPLWGSWQGSAIVAQLKHRDLRRFAVAPGGAVLTPHEVFLDGDYGRLRAAVQAPDGALYATSSNGTDDVVLRIVPGTTVIERHGGDDRYATAAATSQRTFPGPVRTVHVATGTTYPDALAGGAAAAHADGPLLLVTPTAIPDVTRAEIRRLAPERIVVLGGTGAVSSVVEAELATLATGGTMRLGGLDRYETAAAISRATFGRDVPIAYIATGTDYPDALAGVPAAGAGGGPVLLVRPTSLPAATGTELARLRPGRIVVLGGTGAVSAGVQAQLQAYTATPVERRTGLDRYETAVTISRATFGAGIDRVVLAIGTNFPDGLAGGPVAADGGGPLLLVRPDSVPPAVLDELRRLRPRQVVLLGGEGVMAESVRATVTTALNP